MNRLASLFLLLPLALAACGEDHDHADPDVEGCEHLEGGPFVAVTAEATLGDAAPSVADDHRAYTVTLPAGDIGHVKFAVAEAGDYLFFLDQPVDVEFSAGAVITPEQSTTSSPACATIRGRHLVPLGVGTTFLRLSSATIDAVNLVIEPSADDHDH